MSRSATRTYFSEAFKQYTGDSFVNDVKKMWLEEANRMLADDKIADISRQGYEHVKQFNRVFKELEGINRSNIAGNKKVSAFAEALRIDSAFVGSL
ncbi:helix-turn-helix domain-containing protein [Paenibacillus thiaminolyticus]|uniref:helix-turn-helix domain-containing protein n=1 Tax=Paenibacillus thiaminolyticus TaxID=49283 RepID=UPI0035A6C019